MHTVDDDTHKSFVRNFAANQPAIRAYLRRLVPLRGDADDIIQQVAIVLWEKYSRFDREQEFLPWALGIARYEVLAWKRDKARDRLVLANDVIEQLAEQTASPGSQLEARRAALEQCFEKVPPENAQLLRQVYQPDVQIQQLAATSGRTVAGFYQWLFRMRRLLADCIQRELAGET